MTLFCMRVIEIALLIFVSLSSVAYAAEPDTTADASSDPPCPTDMASAPRMSAFVLGGSGEIGFELLHLLAADERFSRVVNLHRREVVLREGADGSEKVEFVKLDYDKLAADDPEEAAKFEGYDVGFCTLGTTRGKSGKEGFIKVDQTYTVAAANAAASAKVGQFHLCSSRGASSSSFFLYPSVKGKSEEAISALPFARTAIYRPAMLTYPPEGRRESRLGEKVILHTLLPVARLFAPTSVAVRTTTVAKAMLLNVFRDDRPAKEIIENPEIRVLGGEDQPK